MLIIDDILFEEVQKRYNHHRLVIAFVDAEGMRMDDYLSHITDEKPSTARQCMSNDFENAPEHLNF